MPEQDERMQILEMVESGTITPDEAARLLAALENEDESSNEGQEVLPVVLEPSLAGSSFASGANAYEGRSQPSGPAIESWRRWWFIPMWVGVGITTVGALFMFWALQASGLGFWFLCASLPFLLGLGVMMLAWGSRTARWLHIRIRQKPGERPQTIAFSFPLPIRITAWFLHNFGARIPKLKETGLDEVILALGKSATPQAPFYVEINEGEDGEQVQVYIG
jgi:hypothetical protein